MVSAREAVDLIRDGDTLATTGFVGIGFAENLAVALGVPREVQREAATLLCSLGDARGRDPLRAMLGSSTLAGARPRPSRSSTTPRGWRRSVRRSPRAAATSACA